MQNEQIDLPGLADWQVNGFCGVDFNRTDLTPEKVRFVSQRLAEESVTDYMPTLITNSPENMEYLVDMIAQAMNLQRQSPVSETQEARIAGIHLEGPFISPHDGAHGAHPKNHVAAPDPKRLERLQELANGRIRILTLAPEWPESETLIRRACAMGIRVAIGHTLAAPEQIVRAVEAGATLSTHLGNGIPAMLPRHPNPVWSQLAAPKLWASVIADGFHLPKETFDVFRAVKQNRLFLVSDCTEFAGMPPGNYTSPIGGEVTLTPEGRLQMTKNDQLLAGSALSLRQIIEKMVQNHWLSRHDAWEMGAIRPRRFLEENA
ncbi:MAG: N-acetylglucosamine-6-phosphate deacetylase [Planctomycetaceae bacterium]|nr:N-acetylglucosamine-6-phosphate deacetylase [Planctomycetaceae bacterium]